VSKELLELVHRTRVSKYAQGNPKALLNWIIEEIRMKTGHYGYRSWELMVEYIARWLVLNKQTGLASLPPMKGFYGLKLEGDKVYNHLDGLDLLRYYVTAAKAKPWDYIGDVYTELGLVGNGQNMTPRGVVEMMIQMTYAGSKLNAEECTTAISPISNTKPTTYVHTGLQHTI